MIFFLFHIEIEGKCGWIIVGGGCQSVCWTPSQIIGGPGPPWPPLFLRLCLIVGYSSEQYSVHLLRICCSSVRHFPDLFWIVVDLPCFSEVRSITSWYAVLLCCYVVHASFGGVYTVGKFHKINFISYNSDSVIFSNCRLH